MPDGSRWDPSARGLPVGHNWKLQELGEGPACMLDNLPCPGARPMTAAMKSCCSRRKGKAGPMRHLHCTQAGGLIRPSNRQRHFLT